MADQLTVAVVGAGNWGKNLVRNFAAMPRSRLKYVCDLSESLLRGIAAQFPTTKPTCRLDEILRDPEVQAVVVATKAASHHIVAKECLEAGKHVYIEKPLALSTAEAAELVKLADHKRRKLMVGHLLEYHPAVLKVKDLIDTSELGDVYYIYTQRVNLGVVRQDENAWWSLAPHDISVICFWMNGQEPVRVSTHGQKILQKDIEDVVFASMEFADGRIAHVHVSWLDPHKIRKMTVVGSKKMAVFDDMDASEKIRLYDKGASVQQSFESYAEIISLRTGDIVIPHVDSTEPLRLECQHFVQAVLEDKPIRSDGADGLRVVRVLQAGQKSLERGGCPEAVEK
jgi:predicted dehydrogenase